MKSLMEDRESSPTWMERVLAQVKRLSKICSCPKDFSHAKVFAEKTG